MNRSGSKNYFVEQSSLTQLPSVDYAGQKLWDPKTSGGHWLGKISLETKTLNVFAMNEVEGRFFFSSKGFRKNWHQWKISNNLRLLPT